MGGLNAISGRLPGFLVDTDVFILWQHNNRAARRFLRRPPGPIYYSKQTRKELLHPFLRGRERRRLTRLLKRFRQVNPDGKIAAAFSELLAGYPYLRSHLGDALIAATAWAKHLDLVAGNARHFAQSKKSKCPGSLRVFDS